MQCEDTVYFLINGSQCQSEASHIIFAGCRDMHVSERKVCGWHLDHWNEVHVERQSCFRDDCAARLLIARFLVDVV